jgi:hypothetical protein
MLGTQLAALFLLGGLEQSSVENHHTHTYEMEAKA